jgi:adenylate cyclase
VPRCYRRFGSGGDCGGIGGLEQICPFRAPQTGGRPLRQGDSQTEGQKAAGDTPPDSAAAPSPEGQVILETLFPHEGRPGLSLTWKVSPRARKVTEAQTNLFGTSMRASVSHGPMSKTKAAAIVAVFAVAVAAGLHAGGLLEPYSLKTLDLFFKKVSAPPPRPDILLVTVAQPDLDFFKERGVTWPWPRQLYAPLVEFCRKGGAKAVVLDILFTEPSSYGTEDDLALGRTLARVGNVVLPVFLSRHEDDKTSPDEEVLRKMTITLSGRVPPDLPTYASVRAPVKHLSAGASALGNVECRPDSDGVYRRMPLVAPYAGRWVPSLALAAFQAIHGIVAYRMTREGIVGGGMRFPLQEHGNLLLRFRGPSGTFPTLSAANVIQSQFLLNQGLPPIYEPGVFADKWVLLGLTAPGLMDLKATPTDSVFAGVEIHATMLDNLLQGVFLRPMPLGWSVALAFLVTAVSVGAVVLRPNPLVYLPVTACVLAAHLCATFLAFREGWWVDPVIPAMAQTLGFSAGAVYSYATEGRQRLAIRRMFAHYLSEAVIDHLLKHPQQLALGGERRLITIFFSDLASFTTLSEQLAPEELVSMLNEYMSVMTEIILEENGTVDKFQGDSITAFWGAPVETEDHAYRACRAAIRQQDALVRLNESLSRRGLPALRARVGIHTGEVIVGNLGSQRRFDYTVIGDAVNLASRLEGLNKLYNTTILTSQDTVRLCGSAIAFRELDDVAVKGKVKPVRVYEVLGLQDEIDPQRAAAMVLFAEALQSYREARFGPAMERFARVLEMIPGDGPSQIFLQRCSRMHDSPAATAVDLVVRMDTK